MRVICSSLTTNCPAGAVPLRAACEARALVLGRILMLSQGRVADIGALGDLTRAMGKEDFL